MPKKTTDSLGEELSFTMVVTRAQEALLKRIHSRSHCTLGQWPVPELQPPVARSVRSRTRCTAVAFFAGSAFPTAILTA